MKSQLQNAKKLLDKRSSPSWNCLRIQAK